MHTLILIAWFTPVVCAAMLVFGIQRARITGRRSPILPPRLMIIQITTVGNERTVNEIIRRIRDYQLDIPFSIWVVTEPGVNATYHGVDELIVVPKDFRCRASYKARALEYSRRLRVERGLNDYFIKILFVDDDGVPTKGYIEKVFRSQYDVCEGIPTPRNGYGRFLSHMDDLRTINCIYMCSVFQGIGHPIHVHGEGLCVRGTAESSVTWDYEMFASEDLVFGHMAVVKESTWGFVWDYMEITSPFTWRDFLTQRRRWLWGNIHAVTHVLPWRSSILLVILYSFGVVTFLISTIGIVLVFTGAVRYSSEHPAAAPGIHGALARAVRDKRVDQLRRRGVLRSPSGLGRDRGGAPRVRDVGRGDRRPGRRPLHGEPASVRRDPEGGPEGEEAEPGHGVGRGTGSRNGTRGAHPRAGGQPARDRGSSPDARRLNLHSSSVTPSDRG